MANTVATYLDFAAARAGDLYRSACLLTGGDTHLAEDLVQETLGRVFVRWRRVSGADNPAAYAQTMLVHTFLSWRRLRRSREQPTEVLPEAAAASAGDTALRITLMDALARLSARDRAVLVLRYWEDRSIEQTASVLRLSPGAVSTRSTRALSRLRSQLGDDVNLFAEH
ncbi:MULTISPECIES: SigE family RNA polymerase sigma factor [Streptacidiphilus]|uniref:SigE family RNA polymerase sigma factor n=2 Tax=Streptacidiphilus TaxID=228398 RepID=A0ABV6URS2_9ACTN|nr:SigE family RNA polymerase sigma factor [Streptacidiphilus jeojiense]